MNRVIKFRAWDVIKNRMYSVSGISNTGSYDRTWEVQPDGEAYYTPNALLMQFTGLLDKNGKEIYEGDIDTTDNDPMVVVFKDGSFGLEFPDGTAARFLATSTRTLSCFRVSGRRPKD